MHSGACLLVVFLIAVPAFSQVAPEATGGSSDDSQMMMPPPVSGQAYPSELGGAERSNFLRAGLTFTTSYIDNFYAGSASTMAETSYSILPMISYDQTTPRQHRAFTYRPGFTFYQPSSVLNDLDQSLNASYQYRLTEHLAVNVNDFFQKSSTAFSSSGSDGGVISGGLPTTVPGIIAPFAERLTNSAEGGLSFQFSQSGMVGVSGSFRYLSYPNPSESTGLYGSDNRGGSVFCNRRISATQYMGVNYQYSWVISHVQGADSETQTHTINAFYTIAPKHNLSFSISGGPQHYSIEQSGLPASGSWGPAVTASMGWQESRINLAASYSREVSGGGGLLGVFKSSSVSTSVIWQISRAWMVGGSVNYTTNKSVTPLGFASTLGGDNTAATASISRPIGQQLDVRFEYDRLHQSYASVQAIAGNPDSNREQLSITWQFARPIGQ